MVRKLCSRKTALPHIPREKSVVMEAITNLEKQYQYSVEIGHAKQGSEHVLILKSLKVRDDDLADVVAQLQAALESIKTVFHEGGFTQ